jgi:hypothetical protein
MSYISEVKINNNENFNLKDTQAINKINFNGKEYKPNNNGVVEILNDLKSVFDEKGVLQFKVIDDISEINNDTDKERTLYICNGKLYIYKENNLIFIGGGERLPSSYFETKNIDFGYISTENNIKRKTFLSWQVLYDFLNEGNANPVFDFNGTVNYTNVVNKNGNYEYVYNSTSHPNRPKYKLVLVGGTNSILRYYETESSTTYKTYTFKIYSKLTEEEKQTNNAFARSIFDERLEA